MDSMFIIATGDSEAEESRLEGVVSNHTGSNRLILTNLNRKTLITAATYQIIVEHKAILSTTRRVPHEFLSETYSSDYTLTQVPR